MPEHIVSDGLADMLTLTGKFEFTIIVIAFDVAGKPVVEQLSDDVISHVITSLFESVVDVYVELVAPMIFVPLLFH